MKNLTVCLLMLALACAVTACKTSTKSASPAAAAPAVAMQAQDQQPTVLVRGEVRRPVVPWTEDLTLSRAIIAADYYARLAPMSIYITRNGKSRYVSPRRLLSGTEDPQLEPGDLVELRK